MKVLSARNPKYTELGMVDIEVLFEELSPEWVMFTADPDDSEEYGRIIYNNAIHGMYGTVEEWVDPRTIDDFKDEKLSDLKKAFDVASSSAHVYSSLGFEIDANETANRNVASLIRQLDGTEDTVTFRDYNNEYHTVNLDDLKIMQKEIDSNGSRLYALKWKYEAQINSCTTIEDVKAITIDFEV